MLSRTLRDGEKITTGGFVLNILKKLNGERLGFPLLSTVDARAIGRGEMAVCMIICNCAAVTSEGVTVFNFVLIKKIR